MNCKLKGVRADGTIVFEANYPSTGWCYASATGAAIGLSHSANPEKIDHLEIWELNLKGLPDTRIWKDDPSLNVSAGKRA